MAVGDHNGRPDLLVSAYFPQSGRGCLDANTLQFLLFNRDGRPVPWVVSNRMPESKGFPKAPAIFADPNHDGRPKLVVTDCSYSEPPRNGTNRRITGIYEAKDAAWSLMRPTSLTPYTAVVRRSFRFRPSLDLLLPSNPLRWSDLGNRMEPQGPPLVRVGSVLAP